MSIVNVNVNVKFEKILVSLKLLVSEALDLDFEH